MTIHSKKKQLLLDTALSLFMKEGFLAVGIDRILAESGVAKMTLYKHFPSKQALIFAVLAYRDQQFFASLQSYANQFPVDTGQRLAAIFEWHLQWVQSQSFRGCAFVGAAVAFPEASEHAHQLAAEHKQRLVVYLQESRPEVAYAMSAKQLMLILEGAVVLSQIHSDAAPMQEALDWVKSINASYNLSTNIT